MLRDLTASYQVGQSEGHGTHCTIQANFLDGTTTLPGRSTAVAKSNMGLLVLEVVVDLRSQVLGRVEISPVS